MNTQKNCCEQCHCGHRQGKLTVVGIGPGGQEDRTRRAEKAIQAADVVVSYSGYLRLIEDLTSDKEIIATGMTEEVQRCTRAVELAREGRRVALISSGDPGVYAMAGLVLQIAAEKPEKLNVEIVAGITAANAAAARLGAPLMLDYAVMSLSDLLVPWEKIRTRLEATAAADFVVALYNPRSKTRVTQLAEAAEIFRKHRPGTTPVGIATEVGTADEKIVLSDLAHFENEEIGMRSVVIIGNLSSLNLQGWLVTPRGYRTGVTP